MIAPSPLALRLLAGLTIALLLAPFVPALPALVLAADAGLALAVGLEGAMLRRRPPLRVSRRLPERAERGKALAYGFEVENPSQAPLLVEGSELADADLGACADPIRLAVSPGGRATVERRLLPARRGTRRLGPARLTCRRPFGLAELRLEAAAESLVVAPSLAPARRAELALATARASSAGVHRLRMLGTGREFDRLRDYVPGDDVRHVDWRATARRRFPVTRVFRAEREQNVLLCIDTGRLMGSREGDMTRLDAAVEAALALSAAAQRNGDRVGLLTFDDEPRLYLPPHRGAVHSRRILEALSEVEARRTAADPQVLVDTVRSRCRQRSLVVVVTDALDEQEGRQLVSALPSLSPPHVAVVVFFREDTLAELAQTPPGSKEAAHVALAARDLLEERRRTILGLRKRGLRAVEAGRSDLAAVLLSSYLEIKNRQVL